MSHLEEFTRRREILEELEGVSEYINVELRMKTLACSEIGYRKRCPTVLLDRENFIKLNERKFFDGFLMSLEE